MPLGDGTGPAGLGPMTGRAAGYCAGYGVPGFMNPIPGRFAFAGSPAGYPYPTAAGYGAAPYASYGGVAPFFGGGRGWGRGGFGRGRGRGWGRGFGRGQGRGFGRGRGSGYWW